VGQPISWQYVLVWSPMAAKPAFTVYRQSSAGHRFLWAAVPAGEYGGSPTIDQVLEELYGGLLALMEATV
jgi:hypothetical protein